MSRHANVTKGRRRCACDPTLSGALEHADLLVNRALKIDFVCDSGESMRELLQWLLINVEPIISQDKFTMNPQFVRSDRQWGHSLVWLCAVDIKVRCENMKFYCVLVPLGEMMSGILNDRSARNTAHLIHRTFAGNSKWRPSFEIQSRQLEHDDSHK